MSEAPSGMQCIYCWTPVRLRPDGQRTWGKGEDEDVKRWMHAATVNAGGNAACSRVSLTDDEVEAETE